MTAQLDDDPDPTAALTDQDRTWLEAHGWRPNDTPTAQAFLDRHHTPDLISRDWR